MIFSRLIRLNVLFVLVVFNISHLGLIAARVSLCRVLGLNFIQVQVFDELLFVLFERDKIEILHFLLDCVSVTVLASLLLPL